MKGTVYKLVNKSNKRFYIGSSSQYESRKKRHIRDLKNNKHHCKGLQEDFNTYGLDFFYFEVICLCDNIKEVEQECINKNDWEFIYNESKHSICGDLISYHKNKDEITKKMSETIKNKMNNLTDDERSSIFGRKKEKNNNWRGGSTFCSCGSRINSNSKSCSSCRDRRQEKNPFFGRKHTDETKRIISVKLKGSKPVNARAVLVNGKVYESVTNCSKKLNVSAATIIHRIKSKNPKYEKYFYK